MHIEQQQPREQADRPSHERAGAARQIDRALELMQTISAGTVSCRGCGRRATGLSGFDPTCDGCRTQTGTQLRQARVDRMGREHRQQRIEAIAREADL